MKWIVVLGALALLSGCETAGRVLLTDQVCAGWAAILISPDDVLTEETAQQIEAHNEFGQAQGCWKR